jgi:hypothetical protein
VQETTTGRFCGRCGSALKPGSRFCGSCGRAVRDTPVPSPATEPDGAPPGLEESVAPGADFASVLPPTGAPPIDSYVTPGEPPTPGRPPAKRRRRIALVSVIALLCAGGVVAGLLLAQPSGRKAVANSKGLGSSTPPGSSAAATTSDSTSTSSSSTSSTPSTSPVDPVAHEADSLNTLLVRSASDRSAIVGATSDIPSCANLAADENTLSSAATSRQTLLDQLTQLDLSQLPDSATLVSTLTAAWQASLQSDRSYAAWAADLEAAGCVGNGSSNDPNLQAAQSSDAQATMSKREFVAAWNGIAPTYNLPQYTPDQI